MVVAGEGGDDFLLDLRRGVLVVGVLHCITSRSGGDGFELGGEGLEFAQGRLGDDCALIAREHECVLDLASLC